MPADRASLCAQLFAEASRDGVASHGLNRFPRFMRMVARGLVDIHASPERVAAAGAFERWDGRLGPGNLNAHACMTRAIGLARDHGIGCVALGNTNHWMRGGGYGWQAADAGMAALCWSNTLPNLPPWGASQPRIGNNPLVVAVPRARGHVVVDMAMSQFSVGGLTSYASRGEPLPVDGGYDAKGQLTQDARAILESGRLLPIGFWKGSGLSIVLDVIAAMMSGGRPTHEIARNPEEEIALSQVFITLNPRSISSVQELDRIADAVVEQVRGGDHGVRYPGEHTLQVRERSLSEGVEVDEAIWTQVRVM